MVELGDFSLRLIWTVLLGKPTIARAAPIFDARGDPRMPGLSSKHSCAEIDTVDNNVASTLYVHYG
jgi:hypothetical protein